MIPAATLAFVPFVDPLPVYELWYLWLLPLCAGVAVVYKCIKCRHVRSVPYEASIIFLWIIAGMVLAAAAVQAAVWWSRS